MQVIAPRRREIKAFDKQQEHFQPTSMKAQDENNLIAK